MGKLFLLENYSVDSTKVTCFIILLELVFSFVIFWKIAYTGMIKVLESVNILNTLL